MRSAARWLVVLGLLAAPGLALAQGSALDPELEAGIRQVDEGNFEAGIGKLDAVARRLKASGDKPLQLSRAYLYLGIAHLQLSQEQAARARFAEAARADQNLKLSEYEFPPPVIKFFEEARRGAAAQPAATGKRLPPGPFLEAAKSGDLAAVKRMLAEDPSLVSAKDEAFGATALHWAALRGHPAVAAQLVVGGADLAARNEAGETPHQVALRANKDDLAEILKPRTAAASAASTTAPRTSPAATAPAGPSNLSIFDAAKQGDVAALQAILRKSPNVVSLRDTAFGATPLHWATLRGHEAAARTLVASGADVGAVNNDGETPLDVARRARRPELETLLGQASKSPKARFFEAVRQGEEKEVARLLEQEPGLVRERDATFGATGLHWAALRGHTAVARLLVARGADARATNSAGETPVDVAMRSRHNDVVRILSQ